MAIQSTGRPRAWRPFRGAIAFAIAGLALLAPGGESSSHAAGAGPPPGVEGATGPQPAVVVVPKSIDATGRTDVKKQLQAFIDGVPNGATIQFQPDGKYRLERSLYVRNRRHLTFDGNGATIFATKRGAPDRSQIWVKRGRRIVFRNLTVRGVHPEGGVGEDAYVRKLETQHGFRFEGTQGVELDRVHVSDVYGDFVYLGRSKQRKKSTVDVWIHDSTFARNGRQGIALTAAENVIIERNRFSDTRRSTIDLEPNGGSWRVENVFILDNTVGEGRLLFIASHGQGHVDDIVISGNVLRGHALTIDVLPPEGERRSNWVVTDNVSDTVVRSRPMRFFSIDGLVVRNNTQRVIGDPGVVVTDSCGAQVAGNEFGAGDVALRGRRCAAALAVPVEPAIPGRGGVSPPPTFPTTPTTEARPGTTAPRPGSTRGPTTTRPAPAEGGGSSSGWIVVVVGLAVVLAAAIAVVRRRRRGSA